MGLKTPLFRFLFYPMVAGLMTAGPVAGQPVPAEILEASSPTNAPVPATVAEPAVDPSPSPAVPEPAPSSVDAEPSAQASPAIEEPVVGAASAPSPTPGPEPSAELLPALAPEMSISGSTNALNEAGLPEPWAFDPDLPESEQTKPPGTEIREAPVPLTLAAPRPFGLEGDLKPLPSMKFFRLSMREAVHLALANNNNIKLQRYAPDLGDAQVRAAFGAFDPILGISFTYNNTETPQNAQEYIATGGESTATQLTLIETLEQILAEIRGEEVAATTGQPIQEPNIFHAENYIGRVELGGKLPLGTRYGFRINADSFVNDINIVQPPGIYSPEYASYAGFVITQPLLRDFGFNANMAEVNVARANRKIGWYDWKAQMIASVYDTLAAYIDLLFAESDVAVKREAAEMARMLERQNTRRMELGQMGPVDVSQAQSAVAEAEEREFLSLSFAVERQGALQRVVLGEAPPEALWFSPNERLKIPPIKPDRSKMIMEAYQLRPEYLRATEEVKKQDVLVRYFRNQVLPRVDAQISYGVSGLSGNYGSSFNSAFGGQGFDFGAGVLVSVPLGSVKERADLDASKMRKAQADIALSQVALNVSVEIDTALSLIEAARARISAAEDFLAAATKNLESEQLMLEEGRSTTFNVVKFQNDLALARTRLLGAQAEYRKSVLRLGVSSGKLLDELGVNIEQEAALLRPLKKNPPPAEVLR